jgi:uncharacterized protein
MRDKLRKLYQVQKEVIRNGYFEGEIALSELGRLIELMHLGAADLKGRKITLKFEFVRNESEIPMLIGRLETSLELECQRCLDAMESPMTLDFSLMIDASDELVGDNGVDTLYSDDGYIDIFEVVEDELILAIPLVAMHENTACNENLQVSESETVVKDNPFAVLQQLKTTD